MVGKNNSGEAGRAGSGVARSGLVAATNKNYATACSKGSGMLRFAADGG